MADSTILRLGRDASGVKQWAGKAGNLLAAADLVYSDRATRYASAEFDVTRATTGTFVNDAGLIEVAQANVPRVDYLNSTKGELLVEPQRTNLLTYSEQFDNAAWAKSSVTLSSNSIISPDGTQNADEFSFTSTLFFARQTVSVSASTNYTFSFYAKKGTATGVNFRVFDVSNASEIAFINYEGDLVDNQWVRINYSFTTPLGCTSIFVAPITDSITTGNIYIWGAQLEEGSYPTSYIPTVASAVTRNADVISLTNASALLGDSEGTLYFEGSFSEDGRISLSDGTVNNRAVLLLISGNFYGLLVVGGTNTGNFGSTAINYETNYKIALKYAANDFALWINGVEVGTNITSATFTASTLTNVEFNTGDGTNSPFYGRLRQLVVFDQALTNAELAAITS